jgi:hypothetical protein
VIYRGYDIESVKHGYNIRKDGQIVCSQPSQEFAMHWIDQEKRMEARHGEQGTTGGNYD